VLTFVAHQAALAVQNARAFEEARDYALRDPLTNLRNGRFLQHYLDRELSRCFRFDEPLSVLGIDLDNFKGINDLRGHEAGDKALKDVADIFRRELRDYDVIVRNGGDEFVAVLPEMDSCRAHQIADRIKESVDQYARKYVRDVPQFGASIGVSTYPIDGEDTCSLLGAADAAMYRDKRARRRHRKAA
jgi:diguanylate cyclase (GGDEF)-like protein